ncbi:MAG: aldo/keto reductase, partial [Eubacteriaceae bacterium]|nr:aldo/keto reductase [Eubacteriaceae bacterium]
MQYRKLGNLDFKVSALGFGCMRLPTTDNAPESDNIDEKEAIRMIRYAIDTGVNYVDTAFPYHKGASETVTGKALKDGYRDKVKLATKSPMMRITTKEQYNNYLDEQLRKLGTDHINFYLFHGLNKSRWDIILQEELLFEAEKAQKAGKISYICFSFHDKYEVFEQIVNGYDKWTLCQIQYNYMDTNFQAGEKGLKLAASKGIGVSVMEPLRGGKLANPPSMVKKIMNESGYTDTPSNLALQWVWSQPEVSVVLSGMHTMQQVKENLISAENSSVGKLTEAEYEIIDKIREFYTTRTNIGCTGCSYCKPCKMGIDIPYVLNLYSQ